MRNSAKSAVSRVGSWSLSDLGSFYVSHKSQFIAHGTRRLGNSAQAEEVVHEALLKVMLAAPELTSEEHAKAYVHRTIENLCMDIFRLEGRRPNLIMLDDATGELESSALSSTVDLSDALAEAEDAAVVRQAISLLSPAERAALVMWEVDQRSAKDIASELGIKETAVKHTVSRARASLRRILSTLVIDDSRGLTGLDLLSRSYSQAKRVARKSSKAALSLILVLFAFAGFNSLTLRDRAPEMSNQDYTVAVSESVPVNEEVSEGVDDKDVMSQSSDSSDPKVLKGEKKSRKDVLAFPGLNRWGIPTGFTIADSTGALGPAYFRERGSSSPVSYMSSSQVIKTESGAANVFIAQTISIEGKKLLYSPSVSFGRAGEWIPLLVGVSKSQIERLEDGNYLVTAFIAVDSAIDSPIRITATANGRDLDVAPDRLITRLVLDSSKTMVLSQAVYVIESETGA